MINLIQEQKEQATILIDTAEEFFATYGHYGTSLKNDNNQSQNEIHFC